MAAELSQLALLLLKSSTLGELWAVETVLVGALAAHSTSMTLPSICATRLWIRSYPNRTKMINFHLQKSVRELLRSRIVLIWKIVKQVSSEMKQTALN